MWRELACLSARVTTVAHKTDLVISGSTVIVWCVVQAAQAVAGRRIVHLTRDWIPEESFMRIPTPPPREKTFWSPCWTLVLKELPRNMESS